MLKTAYEIWGLPDSLLEGLKRYEYFVSFVSFCSNMAYPPRCKQSLNRRKRRQQSVGAEPKAAAIQGLVGQDLLDNGRGLSPRGPIT